MRYLILCITLIPFNLIAQNASPCSDENYRNFDFWIGNWEVYGLKGNKAGDSRISLILDSCIILEEWESKTKPGTFAYKGKSFNTYNKQAGQWQQTWVDNAGSTTHYVRGKFDQDRLEFLTDPVKIRKDTMAIFRLTFFKLGPDKVRQLGEQSKDNGNTWTTQYDLEYRRKS